MAAIEISGYPLGDGSWVLRRRMEDGSYQEVTYPNRRRCLWASDYLVASGKVLPPICVESEGMANSPRVGWMLVRVWLPGDERPRAQRVAIGASPSWQDVMQTMIAGEEAKT